MDTKHALTGVIAMKTKIIFCCLVCFGYTGFILAGDYLFNPWSLYGCGSYYTPTAYSQESIPYFALHPPVYYSYPPVPRTYGDSPFPYPPGMSAFLAYNSSNSSPQPQIVKNEYIDEASPADQQYQTRMPLRIPNPFVKQSDDVKMSKGVKWETNKTSKSLVVYPTALFR
jgi:hypothetical protein